MTKITISILLILNINLFATTLDEFEPYSMYNNPREEITEFLQFARENSIPTAGVMTLYEMHSHDRGIKKLFRIDKEEIRGHIFYHAFYITKDYGLTSIDDPYFHDDLTEFQLSRAEDILPWTDNLYELLEDKPEYGKIGDNPYPMVYQRLYLETESGLKYLDEAESFLTFDRPGAISIGWMVETLQPWAHDDDFGYWYVYFGVVTTMKSMEGPVLETGHGHWAKYTYLNMEGENIGHIDINASRPLIDNKNPFKYTIQNAFDQNPATSYVEDTKDDLMEFMGLYSSIFIEYLANNEIKLLGFRLINGFSKKHQLYFQNNRIKKIGIHDLNETLNYQFIDFGKAIESIGIGFEADEIYHGTKYNDTCLAEIDWLLTDGTWLFGGSNG